MKKLMFIKMTLRRFLPVLFLMFFLPLIISGCATMPTAPLEVGIEAKSFTPNPQKAIIYIYRDERYWGAALSMSINLDNINIGETVGSSFYKVEVEAGLHKVESFSANKARLVLTVEAGKIYFVRQEVKYGGKSDVYLVKNKEGKEAVEGCELIKAVSLDKLLYEEQRIAQTKPSPPVLQSAPSVEQTPQSGTGSGFFVSKLGHVVTNAHVVKGCNKVTVGDSANKQVPAEVVNTDGSNDLALLKLSSLEMASAESKSLIQKLSIVVVPLASKGLLRSDDVRLGEKVLVAGYPFGDAFSDTIKVTTGIVSATRGAGDDSGQFQLDAAVQPGNSGGPIYDSSGNIVGVVISQLNKRTFGSLVENVNFGIKASTVRQFLVSSGLSSKMADQIEEKSTEQLAVIAQNQALMVMCLQ
jgi:S1-C subfamily serine protease